MESKESTNMESKDKEHFICVTKTVSGTAINKDDVAVQEDYTSN